jgi:hypothetical protein
MNQRVVDNIKTNVNGGVTVSATQDISPALTVTPYQKLFLHTP